MASKTYIHPDIAVIELAAVMQALSDPCRLAIVRTLLEAGELACHEVPLTIAKATRSHHFSVLREAGLIITRCEGTKCMTSVREAEIESRFPGLLNLVRHHQPVETPRLEAL